MPKSSRKSAPQKPPKDFPLWIHGASGRWCRKVRGSISSTPARHRHALSFTASGHQAGKGWLTGNSAAWQTGGTAARGVAQTGRPAQPPDLNRSEILMLRVTAAERRLLKSVTGENLSPWMRDVLLDEAKRQADRKR